MNAHVVNGVGLFVALAGSATLSLAVLAGPRGAAAPPRERAAAADVDGPLLDASGHRQTPSRYSSIVSLNPVADHLLLHLVEPERLRAISATTDRGHPDRWRFGDIESVSHKDGIEAVLALRPELVIASPFVPVEMVTRLREVGVAVADLGEMRGLATARDNVRFLSRLLQERERGQRLLEDLRRSESALLGSVEGGSRDGLYLSVYGDTFFGGTASTSYADALRLGGVRDLAAAAGRVGWPQYTVEELLVLDPPLIVTREGMGRQIRAHAALSNLAACKPGGRIVEIHGAYDGDAGLGVIQAAACIQRQLQPRDDQDHE